jgi:hypothetical protein
MVTNVKLLMKNVQKPRNPGMTKPDMMHLISEIPEPAAYLAKDRTRRAATKENVVCLFCFVSGFDSRVHQLLRFWAYRKKEGNEGRTANNTYMNQRATDTVLHRCQESHPLSSSPSSSQQQNC